MDLEAFSLGIVVTRIIIYIRPSHDARTHALRGPFTDHYKRGHTPLSLVACVCGLSEPVFVSSITTLTETRDAL